MATPADQRLLELLAIWLESLELHTKYSSLDDDSYWQIQPWPEHQRPSRWILDLARQKTLALRRQVEERIKAGDLKFSDSLEMMIFLANLVGSEHLERFIPVADAHNERALTRASAPAPAQAPARAPASAPARAAAAAHAATRAAAPVAAPARTPHADDGSSAASATITATREMPKFLATRRTPPPAGTSHVARTERRTAAIAKPAAKAANKQAPKKPAAHPERSGPSDEARNQIIADAARLVQWGRKWFELPELIARMADRPTLPEVRRILKENKSAIEKKAGEA